MAPLRPVLDDKLGDVRLVDVVGLVALAGRAGPAHAAQFGILCFVRMVLAHPADASADRTLRVHALDRPLNELARSSPSAVMSRYSISATNAASTQVAFGALIGFVSFDLGLTSASIWG